MPVPITALNVVADFLSSPEAHAVLGREYEKECAEARLLTMVRASGDSASALGARVLARLAKDPEARGRVERAIGRPVSTRGKRSEWTEIKGESRVMGFDQAVVAALSDGRATVLSWSSH